MKIYSVGPDELDEYTLEKVRKDERLDWMVYFYKNEGYDGSGEAVAGKDELIYLWDLSHCSCYGPLDGWETCDLAKATRQTVAEFLEPKESIFDVDCKAVIRAKVTELILPPPIFDNFNFLA